MARLDGGILSRPSGKVASVIFGAARTREGKVVTAREFVRPSNPRTAAQQANRSLFAFAMAAVRIWGPDIYRDAWNRSVGQLPGFQSMLSSVRNGFNESDLFVPNTTISLGSVPYPDTPTGDPGSNPGEIVLDLGDAPSAPAGAVRIGVAVGIRQDMFDEGIAPNAVGITAGASAPGSAAVTLDGLYNDEVYNGWAYYLYLAGDVVIGATAAKPWQVTSADA